VGQNSATPNGFGIGFAARDQNRRQASNRTIARVNQTGLTGKDVGTLQNSDLVSGGLSDAASLNHCKFARNTKDFTQVFAYSPSKLSGVDLDFDDDLATHQMKAAAETQNRRELCRSNAALLNLYPSKLILEF
jgi:hypothetical protein